MIRLVEGIITGWQAGQANRVQALVRKIFSFALDADLVKANPCSRLNKRSKETARTRTLTDAEIRTFWNAAVAPPVSRPVGLALRLVLALGCRSGEVAGMRRSELELDKRGLSVNWTIPGERSKNKRTHFVPLSPLARDLIGEALATFHVERIRFSLAEQWRPGRVARAGRCHAALGQGSGNAPTAHDLRRTMRDPIVGGWRRCRGHCRDPEPQAAPT